MQPGAIGKHISAEVRLDLVFLALSDQPRRALLDRLARRLAMATELFQSKTGV